MRDLAGHMLTGQAWPASAGVNARVFVSTRVVRRSASECQRVIIKRQFEIRVVGIVHRSEAVPLILA